MFVVSFTWKNATKGLIVRLAVKFAKANPIVSKFGEYDKMNGGLDCKTLLKPKFNGTWFQADPLLAYSLADPEILPGVPAGTVNESNETISTLFWSALTKISLIALIFSTVNATA